MRIQFFLTAAMCLGVFSCTPPQQAESTPKQEQTGASSVGAKIDALKKDATELKDQVQEKAKEAAGKIAEGAGPEIERVFSGLEEVATEFGKHADELQGDSKAQYEKMRISYEEKKKVFEEKLKELKSGGSGSQQDLLKDLYRTLADMKDALDHAAEAFRQSAAVPAQKPS